MRFCGVPGCNKKHSARGLCIGHYQRLRKTGGVNESLPLTKSKPGSLNPRWGGGKSSHPLYLIYHDMIGRCRRPTHPRYADYGGRGINVCQEWVDDFWQFVEDVGGRPDERKTPGGRAYWELDRINNNGSYEPGNIRWADSRTQSLNTRERTRQSHCRKGHEMDEDNTYVNKRTGERKCRSCQRIIESRRVRRR